MQGLDQCYDQDNELSNEDALNNLRITFMKDIESTAKYLCWAAYCKKYPNYLERQQGKAVAISSDGEILGLTENLTQLLESCQEKNADEIIITWIKSPEEMLKDIREGKNPDCLGQADDWTSSDKPKTWMENNIE